MTDTWRDIGYGLSDEEIAECARIAQRWAQEAAEKASQVDEPAFPEKHIAAPPRCGECHQPMWRNARGIARCRTPGCPAHTEWVRELGQRRY